MRRSDLRRAVLDGALGPDPAALNLYVPRDLWSFWNPVNTPPAALFILTLSALPALPATAAEPPASIPYTWKSVQIVGGGFVDGFVFHPTAKDLVYARTDIGGAYRRDPKTHRWIPMLDWVPYADLNLMGVESIAVDPSDPSKVYLACGTYTAPEVPDGAILRSSDQGRTFERTNVPIKFGGNEAGRGNGERMAVDPNDGRVLFLGTRKSGLWKSADGAVTWTKVATFPSDVLQLSAEEAKLPAWSGAGRSSIVFVVFDPTSGSKGNASRTALRGRVGHGQARSLPQRRRGRHLEARSGTADQVPSQPRGAGLRRKSLRQLRDRSGSDADGRRRGLEAGHAQRRLDRHHPGQAGRATQVRIRRRLRRRAQSEGLDRQLFLPSQGRGGLSQHRRGRDLETGVWQAAASTTTRSRPTSRTRTSTGCSTSRSIPRTRITRCSPPATAAGRRTT